MRSFKDLREKTLTPAEKKKREEIAKAMERENPGMDMKKKMAIATWQAKKVAEQADSSMCCKHCGDEFGKPTNEKCMYDAYDPKGKNWVKKESYKEAYEEEPASPDEKSMAMRQAKFITYVGGEIMEHLEQDGDFPEWMQNKLSELHQKAKDMHSTMAGNYEDDMDEAVRKGAPKMQGDFLKKERERNRAHDAAMGRTPTGRKKPVRTMTSTQRSLAKLRNEETQVDEISKKTLGSYVKKASADVANRSADNARDYATGNRPVGANKKAMKNMKRTKYLNKAVDKMTQEGVQSADKKPEKYVKPDGKVGIRMVRADKKVVDKDA